MTLSGIEARPPRPTLPDVDFDWDPGTWERVGGRALEAAIQASTGWSRRRPSPGLAAAEVAARLSTTFPERPVPLDRLMTRVERDVIPLSSFNGHPAFYGYITSSPNPVGVVGNLLAGALNPNTSLWRAAPAATTIELETIRWLNTIFKFPDTAEGIFSSGGQFANVIAYAVMRDQRAGWDVRAHGMRGPDGRAPKLSVYVSDQAHYCHEQAVEFLGMGRESIRKVPTDEAYRMRLDALSAMIAEDRQRGMRPIGVVGTAGTVGTGAVDPLPELVRFTRAENLWLHVDGAYGAFGVLAESAPAPLQAMRDADSIACDPHKWLYAPIDAAITLIRHPGALQQSFEFHPSYLQQTAGACRVDLVERSPENSRPFRAFKVWLALQAYGVSGYRAMIERNIRLAEYMEKLIAATPGLVNAAPRELSIVCWRVDPPSHGLAPEHADQLQSDVIAELERRGIAFVSNAHLRDGRTALRACIVNFRTTVDDVERLVAASRDIGQELSKPSRAR
ncbi:MAG: pyridoxal-dependent decarboxylase [Candidatus Dormibacter sp.]